MSKKPDGYKEWRSRYQSTLMEIGSHIYHVQQFKIDYDARYVWMLTNRAKRIHNMMSAEFDAGTRSAMEALYDVIFRDEMDES